GWSELDPPEGAIDRPGDGFGQHRLADAGNVLDQQVTLRHQADKGQTDLMVLALDDGIDVFSNAAERRGEALPVTCASALDHCPSGFSLFSHPIPLLDPSTGARRLPILRTFLRQQTVLGLPRLPDAAAEDARPRPRERR